jgi:hypothetical protein
MRTPIFIWIAFMSFGIELKAQSVMYTVREKVELEIQKRLIKNKVGKPDFFESYVHNTLSISSANKISEDSITFEGKIAIVSIGISTGVQSSGFIDRRINGCIKRILGSYEVTTLKIFDDNGKNNWQWYDLL